MAVKRCDPAGKEVWVVADGAYAKRPFVRPVLALGVTLVGRLRKDAALRDLPPPKRRGAAAPWTQTEVRQESHLAGEAGGPSSGLAGRDVHGLRPRW